MAAISGPKERDLPRWHFFCGCEKQGLEVLQSGTAPRHGVGVGVGNRRTLHADVGSEGSTLFEFLQHLKEAMRCGVFMFMTGCLLPRIFSLGIIMMHAGSISCRLTTD